MRRVLILLICLLLIGVAAVVGYAFFGDMSAPEGQLVLPVELNGE